MLEVCKRGTNVCETKMANRYMNMIGLSTCGSK